MKQTRCKIFYTIIVLSLISLTGCHGNPVQPSPPTKSIVLEIVDTPSFPHVTAQLWSDENHLEIKGKVYKRTKISLNGFVVINVLSPDGMLLWTKNSELSPSGLRLFRYRYFEETLPPLSPNSKVVIEYRLLDDMAAGKI